MIIEVQRTNVYLDISIDDAPIGRIVIELFDDLAPKVVENFIALCTSESGYKGVCFHRVIKNFMILAGDLKYGKGDISHEKLGLFSGSFAGEKILKENLNDDMSEPFKLCMSNESIEGIGGSQFFITTFPQPHLKGMHSVIGRAIKGKSVVRDIENVTCDEKKTPTQVIKIENCGIWEEGMPVPLHNASNDPIGGDIYEEAPDDDHLIDQDSFESVYLAAETIKGSGSLLFKAQRKKEAYFKYKKALRYVLEHFPDPDQDLEWFKNYLNLKTKIYLNLSLVTMQMADYDEAIKYCGYLLESSISNADRAKALYRRGYSLLHTRKYQMAIQDLFEASTLVNDQAIIITLQKAKDAFKSHEQNEKSKYAKFFQ